MTIYTQRDMDRLQRRIQWRAFWSDMARIGEGAAIIGAAFAFLWAWGVV